MHLKGLESFRKLRLIRHDPWRHGRDVIVECTRKLLGWKLKDKGRWCRR
jgi:hypothetical protein